MKKRMSVFIAMLCAAGFIFCPVFTEQIAAANDVWAKSHAEAGLSPLGSQSLNLSGGGRSQSNRPSNPAISLERAIEIAEADLERRGISATLRSHKMDWERGQWVWELEFRPGNGGVIEYYISVETGAIIKFEWED